MRIATANGIAASGVSYDNHLRIHEPIVRDTSGYTLE